MNKIVGAILCLCAAILFSARYISAAVYMSGVSAVGNGFFQDGLNYVGPALLIAAVISLIAGVVFIIYGSIKEK